MEEQLEESQTFQSIGQVSPALDAVAAEGQGWGGSPPLAAPGLPIPEEQAIFPGDEQTDATDYSFRDTRSNNQARSFDAGLGTALHPPRPHLPPGAAPSMAAQQVTPIGGKQQPHRATGTATPDNSRGNA